MQALKVTAWLLGPIGGAVPMLDALLEWCAVQANPSLGDDYLPGRVPIPIAREFVRGFDWPISRCSSPIFRAVSDAPAHYTTRVDISDPAVLRPDARRIFYGSMGEFKSYRLPLRTRLAPRVVWFVEGDKAALSATLGRAAVRALGKKASHGYGRVERWEVQDRTEAGLPQPGCWWFSLPPQSSRRVLMRPLPASALRGMKFAGGRPHFGGVVPPYWNSRYFTEASIPC